MSFFETQLEIKDQSKVMTRRMGWRFLKTGDRLEAVRRYRGIRKKDRKKLATIEVLNIWREPLNKIRQANVIHEGFPEWTPREFIKFFCKLNKCRPADRVTVIRFRYV